MVLVGGHPVVFSHEGVVTESRILLHEEAAPDEGTPATAEEATAATPKVRRVAWVELWKHVATSSTILITAIGILFEGFSPQCTLY